MRWALLVLLAACEMEPLPGVQTQSSPPPHAEDSALNVFVREYSTGRPLDGVAVYVGEDVTPRMISFTNADGLAEFAGAEPGWSVQRIELEGYVGSCPPDGETISCSMALRYDLLVRDGETAIEYAKTQPELRDWLRHHPAANAEATPTIPRWQVTFTAERAARRVSVHAISGSTRVVGRWN